MKRFSLFFCVLAVLAYGLSNSTLAQDEMVQKLTHSLQSQVLNETRYFTIQLPESYDSDENKRYSVIYRLDGAENLPLMTTVLNRLQNANSAPEVIIVAIENTQRLRDLFPSANQDPRGPIGVGGGGANFLKFISDELIKFVDENYRTHRFRVIAGASAAGVFSLYAMQASDLFDAHIAYSPAVWWNGGDSVKKFKAFVQLREDIDKYLFMSIGNEGGAMRAFYDDLRDYVELNAPPSLRFKSEMYNKVPHALVSSASIFSAYHNLFLSLDMPISVFDGTLSSITDYYLALSYQRAEKITAPEGVLRQLGYQFVDQNKFDMAIKVLEFNVQLNAGSSDAHNGLAFAFERNKQFEESLIQVNKALSLSKRGDDGYDVYVDRRNRLLKLLGR